MQLLERVKFSDGESGEKEPELPQDPPPGEGKKTRRGGGGKPPAAKPRQSAASIARVEKEVAEELTSYMEMAALTWSLRDPVCATALSDQSKEIAEKLTKILARNARLLEWFRQSTSIGDYLLLFHAVAPVLKAVYAHHVVKPEEEVPGGGAGLDQYPPYRPPVG
jgi:hypothetical protein